MKTAYNDAKNFIENINTEEIEASFEEAGDKIADKIDQFLEFLEENIDTESIETAFKKFGKKIKKESHRAYQNIKEFFENDNKTHEFEGFFENLNSPEIETYLNENINKATPEEKPNGPKTETTDESIPNNAYQNLLQCLNNLDAPDTKTYIDEASTIDYQLNTMLDICPNISFFQIEKSLKNAENYINHFIEKYSFIIEKLFNSNNTRLPALYIHKIFTPQELNMTNLEFNKLSKHYNLFITSNLYLSTLQKLMNNPLDVPQDLEKQCILLHQLMDLMESRATNLQNEENI